jgi:Tfp pilus assembly protein PilP
MVLLLATTLGCNSNAVPPGSPAQVQNPVIPVPPIASLPVEGKESPATYQSRERRDPFRMPQDVAVNKPQTVHLRLTGIIREAQAFYALVESDSTPGMGYVIRENDVVDSAKVVKITKDKVVFEMQTKNPEGKVLTRYVEKHIRPVE